jgi:hypothetical protein
MSCERKSRRLPAGYCLLPAAYAACCHLLGLRRPRHRLSAPLAPPSPSRPSPSPPPISPPLSSTPLAQPIAASHLPDRGPFPSPAAQLPVLLFFSFLSTRPRLLRHQLSAARSDRGVSPRARSTALLSSVGGLMRSHGPWHRWQRARLASRLAHGTGRSRLAQRHPHLHRRRLSLLPPSPLSPLPPPSPPPSSPQHQTPPPYIPPSLPPPSPPPSPRLHRPLSTSTIASTAVTATSAQQPPPSPPPSSHSPPPPPPSLDHRPPPSASSLLPSPTPLGLLRHRHTTATITTLTSTRTASLAATLAATLTAAHAITFAAPASDAPSAVFASVTSVAPSLPTSLTTDGLIRVSTAVICCLLPAACRLPPAACCLLPAGPVLWACSSHCAQQGPDTKSHLHSLSLIHPRKRSQAQLNPKRPHRYHNYKGSLRSYGRRERFGT